MTSRPTHDDASLALQLRALADIEANIETPPHVEAAVMAGWDAAHAPRTRSRTRTFVRGAATVAASVTVVGAFALQHSAGITTLPLPGAPDVSWPSPALPIPAAPAPTRLPAPARPPGVEPAVLVLVGEPLAEGEPVRMVRMRVAGSTLAALGIRSVGPQQESLDLDVLVGEDGVARALKVGL